MRINSGLLPVFCSAAILLCNSCGQTPKDNADSTGSEEKQFGQFLDSLKQAGVSDLDKTNEIRKYLAQRIDLGQSKDSLAFNYHQIPYDSLSVFHCLELFQENNLTAKCGLSSYLLSKLLENAGYETYIYDCGFQIPFTHEFVLVKLNGKLVVQDSYYNVTFNDAKNEPKDFIQMLTEIRNGDFNDVKVAGEYVTTEFWMEPEPNWDSLFSDEGNKKFFDKYVEKVSPADGRTEVLMNRSFEAFTGRSLEAMKSLLKEEGFAENYLFLYLKPLHVLDGTDGKEDSILRKQIEAVVGMQ